MAEEQKKPCYCRPIAAIIIAILALLDLHQGLSFMKGRWDEIVILILAIMIAVSSFIDCCCCTKLSKTKEGESCCAGKSH